MKLRDIDFGPVQIATGALGFFSGREYFYHRIWKFLFGWLGFNFTGVTFVAKTATLHPNKGNAKVKSDGITFKGLFQKCIYLNLVTMNGVNAVGLTNPGLRALLERERWQARKKPFFLSVMSIAGTREERLDEHRKIARLLMEYKNSFRAKFGLQINLSCPNTGHDPSEFMDEAEDILNIYAPLGIPLVPKLTVESPLSFAMKVANHPACDAIIMGNTLKYGQMKPHWWWNNLFGSMSPLRKRGMSQEGGLSGTALYPLIREWIRKADQVNFPKPIIACGGIMSRGEVRDIMQFSCVKAIAFGTVCIGRPWRVKSIVKAATDAVLVKNILSSELKPV